MVGLAGYDTPGQPTKYREEFLDTIIAQMARGLSLAAAASYLNVSRATVYNWIEKHPEFAAAVGIAQAKRQAFLEERLLGATEGPVVTSSIFALKNAAAADWREKQDIEHSGLNVVVNCLPADQLPDVSNG